MDSGEVQRRPVATTPESPPRKISGASARPPHSDTLTAPVVLLPFYRLQHLYLGDHAGSQRLSRLLFRAQMYYRMLQDYPSPLSTSNLSVSICICWPGGRCPITEPHKYMGQRVIGHDSLFLATFNGKSILEGTLAVLSRRPASLCHHRHPSRALAPRSSSSSSSPPPAIS